MGSSTGQLLDRECFVCHQPIRVQRDQTKNIWIKFNLDGSAHIDERKRNYGGGGGSVLADRITSLEIAIKNLSTQIETLSELIRRQP